MDLEAQRDQLQALAEAQGVDLAPINDLPDDPRLKIAALASLLEIDPMAALRGTTPVKRLATDARRQQRARAQYEKEEVKRLRELGIDLERRD